MPEPITTRFRLRSPWPPCHGDAVTDATRPLEEGCVFCAIAAGEAEASVVFEDDTVVAFMDLHPVVPGHLLVVPRIHAVGLEDLDLETGRHVWSAAQQMARALRRSELRCEGINLLVCDGEAAFQTVFHFHLHVIPRYPGDGWDIVPAPLQRDRTQLDHDAQLIREAITASS